MRYEHNVEVRCLTIRSSDTTKGVDSSKQQGGGHRSRYPLRSVSPPVVIVEVYNNVVCVVKVGIGTGSHI